MWRVNVAFMSDNSRDKQKTVKCPFHVFSHEVWGLFEHGKQIRRMRKPDGRRLCARSCSSVK